MEIEKSQDEIGVIRAKVEMYLLGAEEVVVVKISYENMMERRTERQK